MLNVGADIGKALVKLTTRKGGQIITEVFPSIIYPHWDIKLRNHSRRYDFLIDYKGNKYIGGTLGEDEGTVDLFNSDMSKNHDETLIALLTGLTLFNEKFFNVVFGTPIDLHTDEERNKLLDRIRGMHEITVNGQKHIIGISNVKLGPEGASSFHVNPSNNLVRIIDFGSTTVNYATIKNKRYISKESGTKPYGMMNTKNTSIEHIAHAVVNQLKGIWQKGDEVHLVGGGALEAKPIVEQYFSNVQVPSNYLTITSEGFHRLGESIWQ